ncbi:MAG: SpoIIE family protein phosphatase [Spirochaetales bacterium]|nr:SpoIIE family protein phosphatase [Spirochaetales bacterium]
MKKFKLIAGFSLFFILFGIPLYGQNIYWENPMALAGPNVRFPSVASGGELIAAVWQEFDYTGKDSGNIYLTLWTSSDAVHWKKKNRFLGPYFFAQKETQIFSLTVNEAGEIKIAVSVKEKEIKILRSLDGGETFSEASITADVVVVSPRLFTVSRDQSLLFVTYGKEDALSIWYCLFGKELFDGSAGQTVFGPFVTDDVLGFNFLPSHASFRGREYVVFQSRRKGETTGFQLYVKTSGDGGRTWSDSRQVSDFPETIGGKRRDARDYFNQRPFIKSFGDKLVVVWERQYRAENPQIYYMELSDAGERLKYERVTTQNLTCYYPRVVVFRGTLYLIWFDNRRGEDHIIMGEKTGIDWAAQDLSRNVSGSSQFAESIELKGFLYIFWQNKNAEKYNLYVLQPDQTVSAPSLTAVNFTNGRKANLEKIRIKWNTPGDSTGISGYKYVFNQEEKFNPNALKDVHTGNGIELEVPRDGMYTFYLVSTDYAGNTSEPVSLRYIKDGTPPGKVSLSPLKLDERGFVVSNTFSIQWTPPPDDSISGYSYGLLKVSSNLNMDTSMISGESLKAPPSSVMIMSSGKSYNNLDNGVYAFSVRAVDSVGNPGNPSTEFFKLNKYRPVTYISYIDPYTDELGVVTLTIGGRGFLTEGRITTLILDRDGVEPYDYVFRESDGQYRIRSDRVIDNLVLRDINEGTYRVGLLHDKRGLYFDRPRVRLDPFLTVKILPPDADLAENFKWVIGNRPYVSFTIQEFILWLVLLFLGLFILAAGRKLLAIAREGYYWRIEALSIIRQEPLVKVKEIKMAQLKMKGMGLRIKFASLIITLVILIVLMVSVTLSYYMIQTQQRNLADGLYKQANVLLGSLSLAAEKYLPINETIELGVLPDQAKAMEDAKSATITAIKNIRTNVPTKEEYVWATNDREILNRTGEEEYRVGETDLKDKVTNLLPEIADRVNRKGIDSVSDLVEQHKQLTEEATQLSTRTDAGSVQRYNEIIQEMNEKNRLITSSLHEIGSEIGSYPVYDADRLENEYIFFKPIVYRKTGEDIYFRGLVRLVVSTRRILDTIHQSQTDLVYRIGFIALIAIGLGILGAILLASITIGPIKKLAKGVAVIRDTEDKSQLKDHHITIKQKDEIRMLADTINQMTSGLVKAAIANKDLTVGKEVQKMFIPLEKDADGKKRTTGEEKNENVEIFGYYEGAKGVSGDYFDFIKLDASHYAIIKCDVAGKGVPAALIMVEVATIFTDYFSGWTLKNPGLKIDKLVYKINDMLEARGFKGRFAALVICIMNIKTGMTVFCNAGDSLINIYSGREQKVVQHKLPEAPAAGVFPSSLVEMQTGFKQVNLTLNPDDMLLLFSDGVDEAKRLLRDADCNPVKCDEPGLKEGEFHNKTHKKGEESEEMGLEKVYAIVDAVKNKTSFTLVKQHNPVAGEEFTFDFSDCETGIKDIILGLISVERMFRIYKDPKAGNEDKIKVDKKIDEFLRKHFVQYGLYFANAVPSEDPEYVFFSHLKEDEQYDDLTILGVRKK